MAGNVLLDIGIIIIVATLLALLAKYFRQPLIPAYIIAGLILGPGISYLAHTPYISSMLHLTSNFHLVDNPELIRTLSEVGVAFLLFMVGLEINFKNFKEVSRVASYGSVVNMVLLFGIGFLIATLFGFQGIQAVYLAFVVVFSSTMVIIKLLSDKKEIDSLHGKILVSLLLAEDVVAVLALFFLSSFSSFSIAALFTSLALASVLIIITFLTSDYFLPKLFNYTAKSGDLLFLSSLAVCFMFSIIFNELGFSIAIGAFVAGIILGSFPYKVEIIGKVKSLKDFFLTLFFVSLGMQINFNGISAYAPYLLVLLFVVLIVKPLLTTLTVSTLGYRKHTIFNTSVNLTQVSEFSLILATQGMLLGVLGQNIFSGIVFLSLITMSITAYISKHNNFIYSKAKNWLSILENERFRHKLPANHHDIHKTKLKNDILLCGCDRTGRGILNKLKSMKKSTLVIDYNPEIIKKLDEEGVTAIYGDISNEELLSTLNFKNAKLLINTVHSIGPSLTLIKEARKKNKKLVIFNCASSQDDAIELYENGVSYVVLPNHVGGEYISMLLGKKQLSNIHKKKENHIKELHTHMHSHTKRDVEGLYRWI